MQKLSTVSVRLLFNLPVFPCSRQVGLNPLKVSQRYLLGIVAVGVLTD